MRKNFYRNYYYPYAKDRLNEAFSKLRKLGYVAKQNFSCCNGCAGYEIATDIGNKIKSGKKTKEAFKGCVFYTKQDTENLQDAGFVYLAYGQVHCDGVGEVGINTLDAAHEIVSVLIDLNIPYEWKGDADSKICVDLKQWAKNEEQRIKLDRFTEVGANI